jgi:hypothetical protein
MKIVDASDPGSIGFISSPILALSNAGLILPGKMLSSELITMNVWPRAPTGFRMILTGSPLLSIKVGPGVVRLSGARPKR